jgi:hypothetical protein
MIDPWGMQMEWWRVLLCAPAVREPSKRSRALPAAALCVLLLALVCLVPLQAQADLHEIIVPKEVVVGEPLAVEVRGWGSCPGFILDFGDGICEHFPKALLWGTYRHTYAKPGTYTITAETRGRRCREKREATVLVKEPGGTGEPGPPAAGGAGPCGRAGQPPCGAPELPPPPSVRVDPPEPLEDQTVVVTAEGFGRVCGNLRFDFGDGQVSTIPAPRSLSTPVRVRHVYAKADTYTVTVVGKSAPQCMTSVSAVASVRVSDPSLGGLVPSPGPSGGTGR